jgi:hypothetical protein
MVVGFVCKCVRDVEQDFAMTRFMQICTDPVGPEFFKGAHGLDILPNPPNIHRAPIHGWNGRFQMQAR